jgi:hypothetical protein
MQSSCFSHKKHAALSNQNVSFFCNFCWQPKSLFKQLSDQKNVSFFSLSHGFTAAHCSAPVFATNGASLCAEKVHHFLQCLPPSKVLFSKQLDASKNVSFFLLSHGFTAAHCKSPVLATKKMHLCSAKLCHFSETFAAAQCMKKCHFSQFLMASLLHAAKLFFQPQKVCHLVLQKCVTFSHFVPAPTVPFSKQTGA